MGMEFFTGGTARVGKPTARISKTGQIFLNVHALRDFGVGKGEKCRVILGYDAEKKQIGIKRVDEHTTGSRSLHRSQSMGVISARAFLGHFDIPYADSKPYCKVTLQNDILLIDLT